jgi:hypothetical protein
MPFTHCASQQGSNCELIFRQSTSMCTASRCPLCRENDPNAQCIFSTVQCSAPLHRRAELVPSLRAEQVIGHPAIQEEAMWCAAVAGTERKQGKPLPARLPPRPARAAEKGGRKNPLFPSPSMRMRDASMPHELVRHMSGLGPACLRAEREDVNKSRGVRRDTEAGHPSPRAIYQRRGIRVSSRISAEIRSVLLVASASWTST